MVAAEQTRAGKQRRERAALSRSYKAEIRKVFGEIRTACRQTVDKFIATLDKGGGLSQAFRPAASPGGSSPSPAPQTAKEQKLSELAEKFRKQTGASEPEPQPPKSRQRDRDKDREPGF